MLVAVLAAVVATVVATAVATTTARAQVATAGSDLCEAAREIIGVGTFAVSNDGATTSTFASSACTGITNDVWFRWTATCNGEMTLSTCEFEDDIDTELAVYTACSGSVNELTNSCDDVGGCGRRERHTLTAELGKQYYFRLGIHEGTSRSVFYNQRLVVDCIAATARPENDECDGAMSLLGSSPFRISNTGASTCRSCDTASCTMFDDVWFSWIATCTGIASIDTCRFDIDTELGVYRSCTTPLSPINRVCDDVGLCGNKEEVRIPVTEGEELYVRVGSHVYGGTFVDAPLQITCSPAVGNDECIGAAELQGPGPHYTVSNTGSTTCTSCNDTQCHIINDVWYSWTAPCAGKAIVSTCDFDEDVDTALGVYSSCEQSTRVNGACDDIGNCEHAHEIIALPVDEGQKLLIRLGSSPFEGRGKRIVEEPLYVKCIQPTGNDECVVATPLNGTGSFLVSNEGATSAVDWDGSMCAIGNDVWYRWT
eukprot:CAMPEP_0198335536 /NCGR_PEP_ID=MMETSP1450-20131203/20379_1 /TAXON_ID=753684 ORGANISM="Madagascaria erythrocladiodes, Strain CCMP3234" /NCGR_SAMPLE_ID=MMETSP1450 /ASSEMBLY_ACC=CAM_ASM_001115 /LENGTH=482 /DNA_ID=CAMNT_0044040209 /DNA_START=47 /DNA_END=1492 /DNA_ORIENTATION=-